MNSARSSDILNMISGSSVKLIGDCACSEIALSTDNLSWWARNLKTFGESRSIPTL